MMRSKKEGAMIGFVFLVMVVVMGLATYIINLTFGKAEWVKVLNGVMIMSIIVLSTLILMAWPFTKEWLGKKLSTLWAKALVRFKI